MSRPEIAEVPNGQPVCAEHYSIWCPYCTVDFSFMQEDLESDEIETDEDDDDKDDDEEPRLVVLPDFIEPPVSKLLEASRFNPPNPNDTPATLYTSLPSGTGVSAPRFVRISDHRELLVYTDGACLSNGRADARAGCGVVFGPGSRSRFRFRLENRGPTNVMSKQTSNRAELRAVIAALQFRIWSGEGFSKLVIAMDSSYVVEDATKWVRKWYDNGWVTARGTPVENRDLWEQLSAALAGTQRGRLELWFWLIPRSWNVEADICAGEGARQEALDTYAAINGVMC